MKRKLNSVFVIGFIGIAATAGYLLGHHDVELGAGQGLISEAQAASTAPQEWSPTKPYPEHIVPTRLEKATRL